MSKIKRLAVYLLLILIVINIAIAAEISPDVTKELEKNQEVDVIVKVKDNPTKLQSFFSQADDKDEFESFDGYTDTIDKEKLEKLNRDPIVEQIVVDYKLKALLADSTSIINSTLANNLQVNGINLTGTGQAVCILDTGTNYSHPDLGGCFGAGCKVIDGYDYINDDPDPMDDEGHGTHVSGIVAANGSITGVAPGANIISIKVLDHTGFGGTSDLIKGIEWCINNASIYNISVITASLGTEPPMLYETPCDSTFSTIATTVANAKDHNLSVVFASGNNGNTTAISAPACLTNATAVAATTKTDTLWASSNTNSLVNFLAPGGSISSTSISGGSTVKSGTSMATPHVAAAIAILQQFYILEKHRQLTVEEVTTTLNSTGKIIQSWPRINIYAAIGSFDNLAPNIFNPTSSASVINITENITLSVNATDTFLDTVWLEMNLTQNLVNYTLTQQDDIYSIILLPENFTKNKTISYRFYANDTASNTNLTDFQTFTTLNTPPSITLYTPSNLNQTLNESQSLNLTSLAIDPENRTLTYSWYLDNFLTNQSQNYTYYANYTSAGQHNLTLNVSDSDLTASITWNLTINNIDTTPYLKQIIPNKTWDQDETETITLSNYFSDADGDDLNYSSTQPDDVDVTINNQTSVVTLETDSDFEGTRYIVFYAFDPAGNNATSNNVTLTIEEASSSSTSSSSSSSSSDDTTAPTTTTMTINTNQESSKELVLNDQVKFSIDGEEHTLKVKTLHSSYIIMTISSDPITVVMLPGQTRDVDVNKDYVNDIQIKLEKIENSKAYLKFKKLAQPSTTPTPTPTPRTGNETQPITTSAARELPQLPETPPNHRYLYWLIPLIAAAIVGLIVLTQMHQEKKEKNFPF